MKFSAQLETYAVPEWADNYVRYRTLKRFLKKKKRQIETATRKKTRGTAQTANGSTAPDALDSTSSVAWSAQNSRVVGDSEGPEEVNGKEAVFDLQAEVRREAHEEFEVLLDAEISKVENHFRAESNYLLQRLTGIDDELHGLDTTYYAEALESKAMEAHRKRLQRCTVFLWDVFDKLDGFVKLNTMAAYKILKKRDKLIGDLDGGILRDLPACKQRLSVLVIDPDTKNYVTNLFKRTAVDRDGIEDIQQALNTRSLMARQPFRLHATALAFFTGACAVLLLDILLLCFIPAVNVNYTLDSVLALFPFFRFMLMIVLFLWAAGVAMYFFEEYGVNYRFLLDIDSKCNVNSETLFAVAAVQSFVWIGCFGIFLADYKFVIFGTHSAHWLYPWLLVLLQVTVFAYPHSAFRYRYRRTILRTIFSTLFCGLYPPKEVTLVANVAGDVLTSFSKPLADMGYLVCYFSSGMHVDKPATCRRLDPWLIPLLVGFPFWVRLVQCYVRFKREPQSDMGGKGHVHVANMGKYLSSLAVVGITAFPWSLDSLDSVYRDRFVWIGAYITATAYSFVWDIYMDWGLFPDPDAFIRPYQQSMYPHWLYHSIALINLLGRLSWALTLMPISILNNQKIYGSLLTLFISTTEIIRRTAWLILRLENEHLTNSSRYRAMLWVPRMVDEQSLVRDNVLMVEPPPPSSAVTPSYDTQMKKMRARSLKPPTVGLEKTSAILRSKSEELRQLRDSERRDGFEFRLDGLETLHESPTPVMRPNVQKRQSAEDVSPGSM